MTLDQLALFQGFPVDWKWVAGSRQDVRQMIANAIPSQLAQAVGQVILAREAGESIPEIQGRFAQWLRRQRGFSKASVWNAKSRLNRARRLLGGRTFSNAAVEIAALEAVQEFANLPTGTRSDLRKALQLYRAWQAEPKQRREMKDTAMADAQRIAA
jgi:DNA (cytosine-5)-methyltransferase 1